MRMILLFLLTASFFNALSQQQPTLVAPGIISTHGVFGFTLSPKGDEAFWVRSNGARDTLIILHARQIKGVWQTPSPAPFSSSTGEWKDIDPVFSPDGHTVLFQSNRPVPAHPDRKGFDIWAVKRTKKGWSEPYHLGDEINSDASESFASIAKNGSIYFMKENPDGKGSSDIYVSHRVKGIYQTPVALTAPLNTTFRESNPFISADEDFMLYFSSDSTGFGDVDLFISFHENGKWTTPKNLGKPINSAIGEFCPFYHAQQRRLYFCRIERNADKRFTEDVYSVDFNPDDYRK